MKLRGGRLRFMVVAILLLTLGALWATLGVQMLAWTRITNLGGQVIYEGTPYLSRCQVHFGNAGDAEAISVLRNAISVLKPYRIDLSHSRFDDNELSKLLGNATASDLRLNGMPTAGEFLRNVKLMSDLRRLDMVGCPLSAAGIRLILECPKLESLALDLTAIRENDKVWNNREARRLRYLRIVAATPSALAIEGERLTIYAEDVDLVGNGIVLSALARFDLHSPKQVRLVNTPFGEGDVEIVARVLRIETRAIIIDQPP